MHSPARILELERMSKRIPGAACAGELDSSEPVRVAVALGSARGPALSSRDGSPGPMAAGQEEGPRNARRRHDDPRSGGEWKLEQRDAHRLPRLDAGGKLHVLRLATWQRELVVQAALSRAKGGEPDLE